MAETLEHSDSFRDEQEPRSSKVILEALNDAEREFKPWWDFCDRIDRVLSAAQTVFETTTTLGYSDPEFDLFWASMEITKPAVYAKPPQPVVAPRFADRNKVATVTSELLERCLVSSFDRGDFDQVMLNVRDDLVVNARGAGRVTYESEGGQRVCDDHMDRCDFLHEPARKWSEVGWVAFASYLSQREMEKRFPKANLTGAEYTKRRDATDGHRIDTFAKCKVWEVWHKADDKVYWITEGVDDVLDESKPFLSIEGFFPCPRPAYGSLRRRSLVPVPDYTRYERHLNQITELTRRIYALLDWIRVKGLIPSGGDVATAVETALNTKSDDVLLIPVPQAALLQGSGQFVQFLPLAEFATAIQGMIEARTQLIEDFYQLSGISDIMRGATEAQETLGAQQLKSQYGSVRVRDKIDELQRFARDVARISAEIIAEKFSQETLLEMSQMEIPTKAEIKKQLAELEKQAKSEMDALEEQAAKAAAQAQQGGEQVDPAQAEQQFTQAQQAILSKYTPLIKQTSEQVSIEAVMELLRSQKARGFAIEIETDSTIMTDEIAEKQSRTEFLTAFGAAAAAVQPLLAAGESGAKLAGGMIKFALAPFRAGRELDSMIDDFVDNAPQALAQQQGDGGLEAAMAEANQKLAQAELMKAQAQGQNYQAQAQLKLQELEQRGAEAQAKVQQDQQKFQLEIEKSRGTVEETAARIEKIYAEIQKMGADTELAASKEQRETVKTVSDIQGQQQDRQMAQRSQIVGEQQQARDNDRADRGEDRADRQQQFTERQPPK